MAVKRVLKGLGPTECIWGPLSVSRTYLYHVVDTFKSEHPTLILYIYKVLLMLIAGAFNKTTIEFKLGICRPP